MLFTVYYALWSDSAEGASRALRRVVFGAKGVGRHMLSYGSVVGCGGNARDPGNFWRGPPMTPNIRRTSGAAVRRLV